MACGTFDAATAIGLTARWSLNQVDAISDGLKSRGPRLAVSEPATAYQRASWLSITPIPLASSKLPGRVPVKVPKGWR